MPPEVLPRLCQCREQELSSRFLGRGCQASLLGAGGGSSWAGQVILLRAQDHSVQSRNWRFLLVHPAQTCLPEPSRQAWLPAELPRGSGKGEWDSLQASLAFFSPAAHFRGSEVSSAQAQGGKCQPEAHLACPLGCYAMGARISHKETLYTYI